MLNGFLNVVSRHKVASKPNHQQTFLRIFANQTACFQQEAGRPKLEPSPVTVIVELCEVSFAPLEGRVQGGLGLQTARQGSCAHLGSSMKAVCHKHTEKLTHVHSCSLDLQI